MAQQLHFPLPPLTAMGAEDFLPSPSNEEAVRWLLQTTPNAWPSHAFVLWGGGGSGKTHLLSIWCAQQDARRVTLGDQAELASAVQNNSAAKAYALDDADVAAGNTEYEEWLQHFYNATKAAAIPLLLTAHAPAASWGLMLRDIETRLKSCASVAVHKPDDKLMRGLLMKLFNDRQLLVDADVMDYLATRIERSGAAAVRVVQALDEGSLSEGRKISVPFAQKTLAQHQPETEDNDNKDA